MTDGADKTAELTTDGSPSHRGERHLSPLPPTGCTDQFTRLTKAVAEMEKWRVKDVCWGNLLPGTFSSRRSHLQGERTLHKGHAACAKWSCNNWLLILVPGDHMTCHFSYSSFKMCLQSSLLNLFAALIPDLVVPFLSVPLLCPYVSTDKNARVTQSLGNDPTCVWSPGPAEGTQSRVSGRGCSEEQGYYTPNIIQPV